MLLACGLLSDSTIQTAVACERVMSLLGLNSGNGGWDGPQY